MKKFLLFLMTLFAMSISTSATVVTLSLANGKTMEGTLVAYNDTVLLLYPSNSKDGKDLQLSPNEVKYFYIQSVGRFYSQEGKFVPDEKTKARQDKLRAKDEDHTLIVQERAANPNEVIGKAFKSTGSISMAVGIPSILMGAVLMGVGHIDDALKNNPSQEAISLKEKKAKLQTAGLVLLPIGASLTIIGIPLYVHGKRIAEMNINYTGNGAGLAIAF